MKHIILVLLAASTLSSSAEAANWKCTASKKVIFVRYNPIDDYAYVQFEGQRYAGAYPITKIGTRKFVGTTPGEITFSCVH